MVQEGSWDHVQLDFAHFILFLFLMFNFVGLCCLESPCQMMRDKSSQ